MATVDAEKILLVKSQVPGNGVGRMEPLTCDSIMREARRGHFSFPQKMESRKPRGHDLDLDSAILIPASFARRSTGIHSKNV